MEALQEKGISTRPATHAVHTLSFIKINISKPDNYFNSHAAFKCSISLPLFNGMTSSEMILW